MKLSHDTSASNVKIAMDILKEIVLKNELLENNYWITFDKIGDHFYEIEFWYAIKKWHKNDKPSIDNWYQKKSIAKNQLHISILEKFEENNIKFALPIEARIYPSSKNHSLFLDKSEN